MDVTITFDNEHSIPSLEELFLPSYCNGKFENINDDDFERVVYRLLFRYFMKLPNMKSNVLESVVAARLDVIMYMCRKKEFEAYRYNYSFLCQLVTCFCVIV